MESQAGAVVREGCVVTAPRALHWGRGQSLSLMIDLAKSMNLSKVKSVFFSLDATNNCLTFALRV